MPQTGAQIQYFLWFWVTEGNTRILLQYILDLTSPCISFKLMFRSIIQVILSHSLTNLVSNRYIVQPATSVVFARPARIFHLIATGNYIDMHAKKISEIPNLKLILKMWIWWLGGNNFILILYFIHILLLFIDPSYEVDNDCPQLLIYFIVHNDIRRLELIFITYLAIWRTI